MTAALSDIPGSAPTPAPASARGGRTPRPGLAGLCWVAWRQHRIALLGTFAALGAAALALVLYGLPMHRDFAAHHLAACAPGLAAQSGSVSRSALHCGAGIADFAADQNRVNQLMAVFLPLPVVFGLFLGAPLLAREYESGTCRFAFTQEASRTRWLLAKIGVLTAFTLATSTAFTAVVMWWYAPLVPFEGRLGANGIQEIYGAVFVARAVFALALGVLAGAVLRRVVPAIAAALVGWIALTVTAITAVRPHLLPRLTAVDPPRNPIGWIISDVWKSPTGAVLNTSQLAENLYAAAAAGHKTDGEGYLYQHGFVHTVVYQPAGRFWALQSIEAGGLLVLAAALLFAAVWLVRRRAA